MITTDSTDLWYDRAHFAERLCLPVICIGCLSTARYAPIPEMFALGCCTVQLPQPERLSLMGTGVNLPSLSFIDKTSVLMQAHIAYFTNQICNFLIRKFQIECSLNFSQKYHRSLQPTHVHNPHHIHPSSIISRSKLYCILCNVDKSPPLLHQGQSHTHNTFFCW